ncbi:hypothetical protein DJ021_01715 [Phenylobacterium hankyongense]|uniref:Lipoprotein n=1 Tax=Phenylobacterium hankyongense TaxID=1813876 RepID=A0A328AVG3_9CAUL|nr:hypothetical protein [Phenylobacterium hankyongense]RAK58599.1 hypothetical protein DJ021_01715 [Phenylobacterium hankyongense]
MRHLIILALTATLMLSACARDRLYGGMDWSLNSVEGEGLKLAYGEPDSDDVLVMLSCAPRSGQVALAVNAPEGAQATINLSSGRRSARYVAALEPNAGDGALAEVTARASDPVLANFGRTGELTVTVDGRSAALPGDRTRAQRFLAGCRA